MRRSTAGDAKYCLNAPRLEHLKKIITGFSFQIQSLYFLQNRYQALGEFEEATTFIFDIFKFLDFVNLNKMKKKNDSVVDKAEDGSADIHYTLEGLFFSWFGVHVP